MITLFFLFYSKIEILILFNIFAALQSSTANLELSKKCILNCNLHFLPNNSRLNSGALHIKLVQESILILQKKSLIT